MAVGFNKGETAIISVEIRNGVGVLTTPAVSTTVKITDPSGTVVVNNVAMSNDGAGLFHYDYAVGANATLGLYRVRITATDTSRVSIEDSTFTVME